MGDLISLFVALNVVGLLFFIALETLLMIVQWIIESVTSWTQ